MILLDADHLSVFSDERDPRHGLLNRRMEAEPERSGIGFALRICRLEKRGQFLNDKGTKL